MKSNLILPFLLAFTILFGACKKNTETRTSILDENNTPNCTKLKQIIEAQNINNIVLTRPFGKSYDTTYYNLSEVTDLYGERLFTMGNEKFQCQDIDSMVSIIADTLKIQYQQSGYDNSGPFTQEFVTNYWESGNGFLLHKKLPSFEGYAYKEGFHRLDSIVENSEKTFIHFGWLNCKGCMEEQIEIMKLIPEMPNVKFVNVTIDQADKLDKYLVDKGNHFEIKYPFNRISNQINKPLLYDTQQNVFDFFHLKGLFPVNFLVNKEGIVEIIGSLEEIFPDENENVEVIRI